MPVLSIIILTKNEEANIKAMVQNASQCTDEAQNDESF